MNKQSFDKKDVLAFFESPAGTVIKMISALPVDIVIELDTVRESHLEKIDEQLECVCLHRAVHEQHIVVVIVEPESVAFDDLDIRIFGCPAFRDLGNIRIDLNARYLAFKTAA